MDEVIGACPSKNTKPFFPATLSRFWKKVVAEKEPNWLLNKPLLTKLEAVRLFTEQELKLAGPFKVALPVSAPTRPLTFEMPRESLGRETVPLTARFCREVVPVIEGLLFEAAPIMVGSRGWLISGYTPFEGLVEPASFPSKVNASPVEW
jgi:hypothetical protein